MCHMRQCIRYLFDFFLHNKDTIAFICQTAYHIFCKSVASEALRMRRNPDPEIPSHILSIRFIMSIASSKLSDNFKQEQTPNHLSISCRRNVRANDFATGSIFAALLLQHKHSQYKIRRLHPLYKHLTPQKSIPGFFLLPSL